jgi:Ferritin-like protein
MLSTTIQEALNNQVRLEAASSQAYLAMASWAGIQRGLDNIAEYFFQQSEEERLHMLKLMRFINERGGFALVPSLEQPTVTFKSLKNMFESYLLHEIEVSNSINELVDLALKEKDYTTHNFLQWYVSEQVEEEKSARILNDKLELIGEDKSGIYLFDRDILNTRNTD